MVVAPVLAAVVAASVLYVQGGDRLSGSGGNVGAPVTIGEEFHTMVFLDTNGGTVELVSARASDASPGLNVDVRLVPESDCPLPAP